MVCIFLQDHLLLEMIFADWPPCSRRQQNNRTFLSVSAVHQRYQRCTAFLLQSCISCNRNSKCRPWRTKFTSQVFAKWTLFNAVPWMTLLLLLTNFFQQIFKILDRTVSVRMSSRLTSQWRLLFIVLFGGLFSLPLVSCQDNLQLTRSVKSLQLPNTMVYVGSSFIYNISEEVFDCEVESFVVSETADRFLSHWLAFNNNKRQLYGVPSEKDEGVYNILVVALSKDGGVTGHVCGSRSFFIKVVPVNKELMVSLYPGTENPRDNIKTGVQSLPCVPGTQVFHGTLILSVDMYSMNGHERMMLLLKMADHLNVHSSKVSFFSDQASIVGQLDNAVVMAAGAGDGRFTKGPRSVLTWHIGCGAIKLEDIAFSKLETNAQDGSISSLLGVPVVGWHVMSGTQTNMAKRRVRRQIFGVTATPLPSSALPSRISNMSTSVIVSRTVAVTSASSNSTAASDVVPSRTQASSFITSVNTTIGSSQLPSSTDIKSSVVISVTSSVISFSPSSIKLTKSVPVNSSTVILSRNTTIPVKSSVLVSPVNRTTMITPSSIFTPTLNSTFITRTVTATNVSSLTTSSSSLPARNDSIMVVFSNETTVVGSNSFAVPSVNSSRLLTSPAVHTSLLNFTVTSLKPQVSSSVALSSSSVAISTSSLNITISTAMPMTISTSVKQSPSSSVSSSNPSIEEASSAVNQTSLFMITVASNSTSLFSRTFSVSSLVDLPTSAFVGNASTPQLNITTALSTHVVSTLNSVITKSANASLVSSTVPTLSPVVPSLTSVISFSAINLSKDYSTDPLLSTSIPMPTSTEGSANKTSFVAVSSLILPSSLILSSSSAVLASSVRINLTSDTPITSSSTYMNVITSSALLSLTPTQLATSANSTQTSVVISMFTSTAKRSALVNSTSVIDRSSLVTSSFSSARTFSSIFASNGTVIATSSVEVDQPSVTTPVLSRNQSLSTFQITSLLTSLLMSTSSLSTTSPSPLSSFEVEINSTALSRTQEMSSDVVNTSAFIQVTLSRTRSSSVLSNRSSAFFNPTLVTSQLTSGTVITHGATPSLAWSPSEFSSSLVTSPSMSQTFMTTVDTSKTLKTSMSLQNLTTMLRASSDVSPSLSTLVASSSSVPGNSTLIISSLITMSSASVTEIPTASIVLSTSSLIRNVSTRLSSLTGKVSSSFLSTSVFVRGTLQTDLKTSVGTRTVALSTSAPRSSSRLTISISSSIASSVQPNSTGTPVKRTVTSFKEFSGTLSSPSSAVHSSNLTSTVTPSESSVTVGVTPSSSVIIPTVNSPPRLYNNMGRVRAPAGKALYFSIPDDTFYDAEDGATTRNLSLSVSLANGTSIPSDFWLQFNNTSQMIYGLPLNEHAPSGVSGAGFLLRARDSQGAEALDAFEVFVVVSEEPIVQELRVRITNDFSAFSRNLSERLLLLQKIAAYYGDSDSSLIRVLSFTSGSVVMTWTNDSLPTDKCDVEKVDYVANKVLLPDGQVSKKFRLALDGFPVESASQQRLGVCNGTDESSPIPPAAESLQEEHLWHKHVLVALIVVFIVLVLAALLICYCRRRRPKPSNEKRTFRKRKPIVLGPEIELKQIPGKPLVLPDDNPSFPPSYISETSLDNPVYSDDEDEVDYGKSSPSVAYEPPPPFHATLADDPRNSPPPAYLMPPMY